MTTESGYFSRGGLPNPVRFVSVGVAASTGASSGLFLGNNLLAYLVLALGGALLVGNGMALVRPPPTPSDGNLRRAPIGRTVLMMIVGGIAAVWAIASLAA